jgi:hypothetical protein
MPLITLGLGFDMSYVITLGFGDFGAVAAPKLISASLNGSGPGITCTGKTLGAVMTGRGPETIVEKI